MIDKITIDHVLKTDRDPFDAVWNRLKKHEIRKDDRNYKVGDVLLLKETTHTGKEMSNGKLLEYTGCEILVRVTHIQRGYGLQDDWCILSIDVICISLVGEFEKSLRK